MIPESASMFTASKLLNGVGINVSPEKLLYKTVSPRYGYGAERGNKDLVVKLATKAVGMDDLFLAEVHLQYQNKMRCSNLFPT
jgi:hypothetical protein